MFNDCYQGWLHGEKQTSAGAAEGIEDRDRGAESGGETDRYGQASWWECGERRIQVFHTEKGKLQHGILLKYIVCVCLLSLSTWHKCGERRIQVSPHQMSKFVHWILHWNIQNLEKV